jgi:hypothetical protein
MLKVFPMILNASTDSLGMYAETLCSVSKVIFEISNMIFAFNSSNVCGLLLYVAPFKQPQRKNWEKLNQDILEPTGLWK